MGDYPAVLLVNVDYGKYRQGISAINRQLGETLTTVIAVFCAVLEATEEDKKDAKHDGVELLLPKLYPGDFRTDPSVDWLTFDHKTKFPHLPSKSKVKCIVGHADVTSRAAVRIKQERYPAAKVILINHDIPEDTDQCHLQSAERENDILEDAQEADVVFSVGTKIFDHFENQFRAIPTDKQPLHFKFLPRPCEIFETAKAVYKETDTMVVLSIQGGVEGHNLVERAMKIVAKTRNVKLRIIENFQTTQPQNSKSTNLQVTFLPSGTQKDICKYMMQADLVLMLSGAEPFGLVGLEAIAAGVPVLVSKKSGLADFILEYVDELRHSIFDIDESDENRSVEDLAKSIEKMLKHNKTEFETAARCKQKLLSSKYWEESHQQFIKECTGNNTKQPVEVQTTQGGIAISEETDESSKSVSKDVLYAKAPDNQDVPTSKHLLDSDDSKQERVEQDSTSQDGPIASVEVGMLLGKADANVLACSSYQNIFDKPRVLPCHHTFYANCLEGWHKDKSQFTCTTCAQQVSNLQQKARPVPVQMAKKEENVDDVKHGLAMTEDETDGLNVTVKEVGAELKKTWDIQATAPARRLSGQVSNIQQRSGPLPVEMADKTGPPTEEEVDKMEYHQLIQLLRDLGMPKEETDWMFPEDARAEVKKRIRDMQAAAATSRLHGQMKSPRKTEDETDEMEKEQARTELKIRDTHATAPARRLSGQVSNKQQKSRPLHAPVEMAERPDLDLPTEEEIDKMKFGKLTRLLLDLGMAEEETEDLEKDEARAELKRRIRDIQAAAETRRRPGQAAANLGENLEKHNTKQERLAELCNSIVAYLPNLDRSTTDKLKTKLDRPAEDILTDVQTQLQKEECPILVAGEISSGKSTFLNMLLRDDILPVAHLSTTSTICEVKYRETRQAVVHLRQSAINTGPETVTIVLDGTEEHQAELKSYMHLEGASRDSLPPAERVEIFWPLPLLEGGIVLVDSPGVGESEMMDKVVADYIPKAFAFLYIIDSSRAGGVQQDRLGKLLELYATKEKSEDFDPESAMFICNKWDLVPPDQREKVRSDTLRKLTELWPGLEESQLFFLSTKEAVKPGGILSADFTKVLDGLDLLLSKSLDIKLETQYRLLTKLSNTALTHIDSRLNFARQNLDKEAKSRMFQVAQEKRQSFEEAVSEGNTKLESVVRNNVEITKSVLNSELVTTGKLKQYVESAVKMSVPFWVKKILGISYSSSLAQLKDEKKETSFMYVNGKDFTRLEDLYKSLAEDLGHCPKFEDHMNSIESSFEQEMKETVQSLEDAHQDTMQVCGSRTNDPMNVRNVLFHKPSLLEQHVAFWKGSSLSSLSSRLVRQVNSDVKAVLGSQSGAEAILHSCWEQAPIGTLLVDILMEALSSQELLTDLAERQMKPQRDLMALLEADITKMRTIMDQTIDQTFKDTRSRSNDEILQTYEPQNMDINNFLGQLAMFHLTEMRKYEYDLDSITGWTDTRNRLGGGGFGEVYGVQVPWKEAETQEAALKLGLMPYDLITAETAWGFLKEEDNLRKLKGDHIVKYYGTACRREGGGLRLGLVMELCEGTLADRIVSNRDHNPAWWGDDPEKQAAAFSYTQNLAVQLCEGLRTIHDAGYIHRNLNLTNILVTKDNIVKIAGLGQTEQEEKITGTVAGTALYAAPEVKERKVYDRSADIYSLGLILWEMWYGTTLYGLISKDSTYAKHMEDDPRKGRDIRMPKWEGSVPPIPEWTSLIHDCLKKDPRERPKIQECQDRISDMKV